MLCFIILVVTSNVVAEMNYFANENLADICVRFCGCYEYSMDVFGIPGPNPANNCFWTCGCDTAQPVSNTELQSYLDAIKIPDSRNPSYLESDSNDYPVSEDAGANTDGRAALFNCKNSLGTLPCFIGPVNTVCTPKRVNDCRLKCDACHCRQRMYEVEATSFLPWGEFKGNRYCADGAVGMRLRTVVAQPPGEDDTALTGMKLLCKNSQVSGSDFHPWGNWGDWLLCPSGTYVIGFAQKSEPLHPTDNTGSNNVKMYCGAKNSHKSKSDLKYPREILHEIVGDGLNWGSWGGPQICDHGYIVCMLNVKIVDFSFQEPNDDEVGMTTFRFGCCCEYR